jgi:hypothetical protein
MWLPGPCLSGVGGLITLLLEGGEAGGLCE